MFQPATAPQSNESENHAPPLPLVLFHSVRRGNATKRRRKRKGCRWRDAHQISKPALISNLKLLLLSSSLASPKEAAKGVVGQLVPLSLRYKYIDFQLETTTAGPKESQKLTRSLEHVIDGSNSCLFSILFHFLRPR